MLTPASSATAFVLNPAKPEDSNMRAAASKIASNVATERAWRGRLRGSGSVSDMGRNTSI
ncbi:hypothetical protein D3C79_1080550 [compost metagenome]